MRIIDRVILNRLVSLIANFILAMVKIFSPQDVEEIDIPQPDKKWRPRWKRKND